MYLSRKFVFAFLSALVVVATAPAQNLDRAGEHLPADTGKIYPPPLYRMNDVTKSLNLNKDQIGKLGDAASGLQKRYRADVEKLGTLNERERAPRTEELRQRYYSDWNKATGGILNEDQMSRYRQLELQHRGFGAFSDPDVQKRLNLTPEQRKQIDEGNAWSQQQWQDINKRGAADRDEGTRMYQGYQKDYQQRLNKILTPEQQKTWQGMTGETYRFQPTFTTPPRR